MVRSHMPAAALACWADMDWLQVVKILVIKIIFRIWSIDMDDHISQFYSSGALP